MASNERRVRRLGNSLVLAVPSQLAAACGLRVGQRVRWEVVDPEGGVLRLRRLGAPGEAPGPASGRQDAAERD